jgi:hypothetical protein
MSRRNGDKARFCRRRKEQIHRRTKMSRYFFSKLNPPRPSFAQDMSDEDRRLMNPPGHDVNYVATWIYKF